VAALNPNTSLNFAQARVLLLDDHATGSNILIQIVRAFGVVHFDACTTIAEAQKCIADKEFHLILINGNLKDPAVYDFINWLRRTDTPPNCYASVILIAGHTQRSNVERARDSGANVILAKPISPTSVLERIVWASREKRPYVKSTVYAGPDRRFKEVEPPRGRSGRRQNDPSRTVSDADASRQMSGQP